MEDEVQFPSARALPARSSAEFAGCGRPRTDDRNGVRQLKEIMVKVYDNDIEKAMRILKKKIQNDGLFKRLKLKKSYEKPSEFKRRKQREALRRERIAAARRARR
jgi:small subunit ribosomal protein S21